MARDLQPLGEDQWGRVVEVLVAWSEVHPRPHLPVLQLGDGRELTPVDIGRGVVEPEHWVAQLMRRALGAAQLEDEFDRAEPLDEILQDFEIDIRRWRSRGLLA